MNIQVRIRTDESFSDIKYITQWLDDADSGFAFEHDKPGNHHYHVYLFGLERNTDAMRRHLGKHLPTKEHYAVGVTAGKKKEKITPQIAYQYAMNPKSTPTRVWAKGYPLEVLQTYHEKALEYYAPIPVTVITKEEHYVVRPDRVWERLYAKADEYSSLSVPQIKSKIATEYLNSGRAIPRTADLHRYAMSLFMINKYKKDQVGDTEIPMFALETEYT